MFSGGFEMIRRILCPTELTAASQDSLAYAFRLAKENGAQLIVFHATKLPTLSQYPCDMDDYFQWQQFLSKFRVDHLLEDAKLRVTHFVRARFEAASVGIDWKTKVALGDAAEEIVRAALQEEADLVVMHRCKKGVLAQFFGRSVSEAVGRSAPCPVLSIDAPRGGRSSGTWRLPVLRELLQ